MPEQNLEHDAKLEKYSSEIVLSNTDIQELKGVSNYVYQRIDPANQSNSISTGVSSGTDMEFNIISNNPYNWSESSLTFTLGVPANVDLGAARYLKMIVDCPPITQLALTDLAGREIANITDFRKYWKTVVLGSLSLDRFQNRSGVSLKATKASALTSNVVLEFPNPASVPYNTAMAANASYAGHIIEDGSLDTLEYSPAIPVQVLSGAASGTAGYAACYVKCKLNFKDMVGTFLSMNKMYYNASGLVLRLTWAPANKVCFYDTAVDTTSTGAAEVKSGLALSEIQVNLATSADAILNSTIKSHYLQGAQMCVPKVKIYSRPIGSVSSADTQINLNASEFSRLLRIYNSVFLTNDSLNLVNNSFVDDVLNTYRTSLNGNPLQNTDVRLKTHGDDLLYNSMFYEKSMAAKSTIRYTRCWSHVDNFAGNKYSIDCQHLDFSWDGIGLNHNFNYNFNVIDKSGDSTNVVQIVVGQKMIMFDSSGNLAM
jgi:hypothetical protein